MRLRKRRRVLGKRSTLRYSNNYMQNTSFTTLKMRSAALLIAAALMVLVALDVLAARLHADTPKSVRVAVVPPDQCAEERMAADEYVFVGCAGFF